MGREAGLFTGVHGGFGYGELNIEDQSILDFSMAYDFKIMNHVLGREKNILLPLRVDL